ncbi:MAG: hypothetical protein ACJAVM_002376 [Sulfitobacter sp.]|jgi:Protein of unknown function (DUF1045)
MFERYAVFYTASAGAFADFGAAWLGWDSATAQRVDHPEGTGLDLGKLTRTPRKYGFHATLKAPFHLADGQSEPALKEAVTALAKRQKPVALGKLALDHGHGFLALRPTFDPAPLRDLVGDIVRDLDRFRAPLGAADIARRRKARLTPRQDQQMLDWGYPYIFEDFNFHMTLSGFLPAAQAAPVLPVLEQALAPVLPAAPVLDAITLMGQDGAGLFHQIHRAALSA